MHEHADVAHTYPEEVRHANDTRSKLRRFGSLLHDETGAQAAEYAMLGGVSAAACGGLIIVFNTSDLLGSLVGSIVDTLAGVVGSWF